MANDDRWAIIVGASTGVGAAIARAVAHERGRHGGTAVSGGAVRVVGRRIVLHLADAGTAAGARACADAFKEIAGERSAGLFVHSISGASLGRFLPTRGDAFTPRQFEKTFDYLAHSFAYWGQALYELDLLASGARLLGLTNVLHDSLLNNTGLVAAAKAALQMYVRHLAMELGPLGHRVNLLGAGFGHARSAPSEGARLWPEPGMAM